MTFDIDILTFLVLGDCLGCFFEKIADFLKTSGHLVCGQWPWFYGELSHKREIGRMCKRFF